MCAQVQPKIKIEYTTPHLEIIKLNIIDDFKLIIPFQMDGQGDIFEFVWFG